MTGTGFAGRSALVTGAAGGMGLAIAQALAGEGVLVTGVDLKPGPADFPGRFATGDVSDAGFAADAVASVVAANGRLDHLVNAAGVLWFDRDRSLLDVDLEVWERVIAINLTGAMLMARHAIPAMRASGGGALVHFSSIQCLRGDEAPQDAYQVSKAGLLALSKSIAIQIAGDGIRSNVILPSATDSPMQARWRADPELKRTTAAGIPLGRVGTAQDMANACLFLLSDRASYITGTELLVDGGRMALP
jgi:NAD(P)-dependent dehydrogenase (short-subunit alcohol dehydrogenase family)